MINKDKFKITIKEENSLESLDIKYPQKLMDVIYIAIKKNDLIIINFQTKEILNNLKYYLQRITAFHLCKKQFFVDNNPLTASKDVFYVLSSSLDKKFAIHKILYKDNIFQFELIAECEPTDDEINGAIQNENGQFIITTRDQHIILYSKYINNKNFNKLYEILKPWPMEALCPFEIKKNIIGVYWQFDDAENDESINDSDEWEINHSNDGLYIYEIKNNQIQEIKILKKEPSEYHSFINFKNTLIMKYYKKYKKKIITLDKTNLKFINNLTITNNFTLKWDISSFNHNYFIVIIWKKDEPITFQIYENKTIKKVYESKSDKKYFLTEKNADYWNCSLYKLNNNEYLLKNLIIKIEKNI